MSSINWTCDTCHGPTDGAGAISITYDDIHRADAVRKATNSHAEAANFASLTVEDALAQPQLGLWKVECDTCAGECIGVYWIDLRQVGTDASLTEWTRHLSSKTWFAATNWDAVVESAGVTQPALRVVR